MTTTQKNNRAWKWICAGLFLAGLFYFIRSQSVSKDNVVVDLSANSAEGAKWHESRRSATYVKEDSLEFVYENLLEGRKVNGLVFLAHGCSHSGTDWWDKSTSCPECIGLPEEKRIVARLVQEGYIPIAVSSQDRLGSRCWAETDITPVTKAIKIVREKLNLPTQPLFAFGASSGGTFVSRLGIDPANGFLATAPQLLIKTEPRSAEKKAASIFFTYMARGRTRLMYEQVAEEYERAGFNIRSRFLPPVPVISTFFSDRIETISTETSRKMVDALKKEGYLDKAGMPQDNPRGSSWRLSLQKFAGSDSLVADESPISEVMNVAFAQHEMSSDIVDEMIDFFKEESLKAGL